MLHYDPGMAAILTEPSGGTTPTRCERCGATFRCGLDAPQGCWCARRPVLTAAPRPGASCLCPDCLQAAHERERVLEATGLAPVPEVGDGHDAALRARLDADWAAKTMPAGALGELQALGTRLALSTGRARPRIERCAMVVFAADHGLAAEGVSAYPQAVTAQMVRNIADGGAAISVLCRANDVALTLVDAGTLTPQPEGFAARDVRFVDARLAAGTANARHGPAMTPGQAIDAIARGAAIVRELDADAIGFGEVGIGNTSSAALLAARLLPAPAASVVGRGTGLDDARLAHKRSVIEACLALHADARSPLAALAAFGGLELAMMVGGMLAAASARRPVVVDGFIATAAALAAARLEPAFVGHCVFSHRSAEPGHALLLDALGGTPLLALGLRLGEGSGAALAMPLLRSASRLLDEMATFASAGVDDAG